MCAIMSTQVTYETDSISVLCYSTMSSARNFVFYLFYCDLKEKYHIRRNINWKKKETLVCEISIIIIIILICQKLGSVGHVQQKIKLPSPNKNKVYRLSEILTKFNWVKTYIKLLKI